MIESYPKTCTALHRLAMTVLLLGGCLLACSSVPDPETAPDPETKALGPSRQVNRAAELEQILRPIRFEFEGATIDPTARVRPALSALPDAPRSASALRKAEYSLSFGQAREALQFAVEACWMHPADTKAWTYLSRRLGEMGNFVEAHSAIARALQLAPQDLAALRAQGHLFDAMGNHRKAVSAWQTLLDLSPHDATAQRRLAAAHFLLGDSDSAATLALTLHQRGERLPPQLLALLDSTERGSSRLGLSQPASSSVGGLSATELGVGLPQRIDSGGTTAAAETHVTARPDGTLIAAWNDLREPSGVGAWSLGVGLSFDAGDTWSDGLLRPAGNNLDDFEGDPMTTYDPRTGNVWVGAVTFFPTRNLYVARLPPAATVLDPPVLVNTGKVFDKGLLAAGPAPGNPNSTLLHLTYNLGLQTSADLGTTWTPVLPLGNGVSQHPRVGPDGTLYIAYWDFEDQILLRRSFDGGATVEAARTIATRLDFWDTQDGSRFPGRFRVAAIAYLAIDPNDSTLYCVYFDTTSVDGGQTNIDLYFTRSQDQGLSWTTPTVIHGDSTPPGDQFHPWLEVDANGRLHLAYFDTRYVAQIDDQVDAFVDLTYATSDDRGDSWSETRLTPTSFNSADATWAGFEQFLGDFLSLAVDPSPSGNSVWVTYPATFDGDLDIYQQRLTLTDAIFRDGFESSTTAAWSAAVP